MRAHLPRAAVSVDPVHLVRLANPRPDRGPSAHVPRPPRPPRRPGCPRVGPTRKLLLRGADTLCERGWNRLEQVLGTDDTIDEPDAAWGVREQLRRWLKNTPLKSAPHAQARRAVNDGRPRRGALAPGPAVVRSRRTPPTLRPEPPEPPEPSAQSHRATAPQSQTGPVGRAARNRAACPTSGGRQPSRGSVGVGGYGVVVTVSGTG